jgi:hypothetical protein
VKVSHSFSVVAVTAVLVAVAGCGDGRSVKVYEPGVYKGAADPLLTNLAKPELKQRLKERFTTGQLDR